MLNNPCFRFIDNIADISAEYFNDLPMHFFGHVSVYPNGEFTFLCTKHDWPTAYFADQKIPPVGFTNYDRIVDSVAFPTMDNGADFGWSDAEVIEAKNRFNILNPMLITRKYLDHIETFIFDLHCKNAHEKYFNNFDLFENFMHYHRHQSRKMIDKVNQSPLMVDSSYIVTENSSLPDNTIDHRLKVKKFFLRHQGVDIALSAKEYECLSLLAHGYQCKSIANELNISARTIEHHLNRIKNKLNLVHRHEIISVYWNSRALIRQLR